MRGDHPGPKTTEDGYALRDHFWWVPAEDKPSLFYSETNLMSFRLAQLSTGSSIFI